MEPGPNGQPQTITDRGNDIWALQTVNNGAAGLLTGLVDNVDQLEVESISVEHTHFERGIEFSKTSCVPEFLSGQAVIKPRTTDATASIHLSHCCRELVPWSNLTRPRCPADGWSIRGAVVIWQPDWVRVWDGAGRPKDLFSGEAFIVSSRACVADDMAGLFCPAQPTTSTTQFLVTVITNKPELWHQGVCSLDKSRLIQVLWTDWYVSVARQCQPQIVGCNLSPGGYIMPELGAYLGNQAYYNTHPNGVPAPVDDLTTGGQEASVENKFCQPASAGNIDRCVCSKITNRHEVELLERGVIQHEVSHPTDQLLVQLDVVLLGTSNCCFRISLDYGPGLMSTSTSPNTATLGCRSLELKNSAVFDDFLDKPRDMKNGYTRAKSQSVNLAYAVVALVFHSDNPIDNSAWRFGLTGLYGPSTRDRKFKQCKSVPDTESWDVSRQAQLRSLQGRAISDLGLGMLQLIRLPPSERFGSPVMAVSELRSCGGWDQLRIRPQEKEPYPCRYQSKFLANFTHDAEFQYSKLANGDISVTQGKMTFLLSTDSLECFLGPVNLRGPASHQNVAPKIILTTELNSCVLRTGLARSQTDETRPSSAREPIEINQIIEHDSTLHTRGDRDISRHTPREGTADEPLRDLVVSTGTLPAFHAVQIDEFGPFFGETMNERNLSVGFSVLTLTCITTHAVIVWIVDSGEVSSIIRAIYQHSYMHGFPTVTYVGWTDNVQVVGYRRNSITTHSQLCAMHRTTQVWEAIRMWVVDHDIFLDAASREETRRMRDILSSLYRLSPTEVYLDKVITSSKLRAEFDDLIPATSLEMFGYGWQDHIDEIPIPGSISCGYHMQNPQLRDFVWFCHQAHCIHPRELIDTMQCHGVWRTGRICAIEDHPGMVEPLYHVSYLCTTGRGYKQPTQWTVSRCTTRRSLKGLVLIANVEEISNLPAEW